MTDIKILVEKMIDKIIIDGIVETTMIEIIHPYRIMITEKPAGEVVIRTTEVPITNVDTRITNQQIVNPITTGSRKGLANSSMMLGRWIITILKMLDDLNMKLAS